MSEQITYEIIVKKLNNVFVNFDIDFSTLMYKIHNLKIRKTKTTYKQAFLYSLLYTQDNVTKIDSVNIINKYFKFNDKELLKRTTLYEKENKIPLNFYNDIFKKLIELYNQTFSDKNLKKLIAVDGTFNNTNIYNIKGLLETSLNLGFFDIDNEIPLDLTFNNIEKKNCELKLLFEYIKNKKEDFKNVILILDRAYCSYNFFNFLIKNDIYFVARIRNNCRKTEKFIKKKNIRIVNFKQNKTLNVENKYKEEYTIDNKKFKSVDIKITDEYNIVTNLSKEIYNDDKIKDLYHKRWDIEVFFKILKNNFNFQNLRYTKYTQDDTLYHIHNIKILIVCLIMKILEKTYIEVNNIKSEGTQIKRKFKKNKQPKKHPLLKKENKVQKKKIKEKEKQNITLQNNKKIKLENNEKEDENKIKNLKINKKETMLQKINSQIQKIEEQNKEELKKEELKKEELKREEQNNGKNCIVKINKKLLFKCSFNLLPYIIFGSLNKEILNNEFNMYVQIQKRDPTINNKHVCKTPFKKWYIKGYTEKSDFVKIIYFMLGFTIKINDNLKTKSNNIVIIKINYIS